MQTLLPSQVRAARGMLDWSMVDLSKAARISVSMVQRFESSSVPLVSEDIVALMQDALETEGVRFLRDDGNGPGVRCRSAARRTALP
jgi:ribosome-binding protein aMBF1 (putative translation factor)